MVSVYTRVLYACAYFCVYMYVYVGTVCVCVCVRVCRVIVGTAAASELVLTQRPLRHILERHRA